MKKKEVSHLLSIVPLIKLNKRILERVTRLLIPDNLTTHNVSESREYKFQIFISSDRIELADKEHVLWRTNIGEGQVPHHLESESRGGSGLFAANSLLLVLWERRQRVFVFRDAG